MKLIINADDFGMSHNKNIAIDEMMRRHICTNTSLVVNMSESTNEAVKMAIDGGYQDRVSLHLNLTEGESLSHDIQKISLYYENNKFAYRPIIKSSKQIQPRYIRVIRKEIEDQIVQFLKYGFELRSIDTHNWVHLRIPVWYALKPLINKYNIPIVRPMWDGYKRKEIASSKWSRYFSLFEPILLRKSQCRIIEHTSNIEQFLVDEQKLQKCKYVEVFTHPDIINGEIIDISSSYLRRPQEQVEVNVKKLEKYERTTVVQVLKEIEK